MIVRIVSCIFLPCFLFGYLFYSGVEECNYTALLNDPKLWLISRTLAFIFAFWYLYALYRQGRKTMPGRMILTGVILCALMLAATILIPYAEDESFISDLHVMMAYASLVVFNLVAERAYRIEKVYRTVYLPLCLLAAMAAVYASRISGPSEAIYGTALSMLTGLCY